MENDLYTVHSNNRKSCMVVLNRTNMAISTMRCTVVTWTILIFISISTVLLLTIYTDRYRVFEYDLLHQYVTSFSDTPASTTQKVVDNIKKEYWSPSKRVNMIDQKKTSIKHILYYNNPGFIRAASFHKCEYKCIMTSSRSSPSMSKSDAVIFFGPRLGEKMDPPKKRKGQIWIFHSKESTANYFGALPKWKNLFNWTMTFRRDSDILAINGIFPKRINISKNLHSTMFSSKSKSIAWFASNCRTPGKRESFVKKLSNISPKVDIYGGCGSFRCPRSSENACMDILREKYKFYLSFENSLCYDYITEKSFKIYENLVDAIPIVRGVSSQYQIYLPPNSYINTDKFANISQLSAFIKKVESNKTLFESFFKWKPYYESYWPFPAELCELCRRVHHADRYRRIISDVGKWVTLKSYKKICRSPKDF